MDHRGPCCDLCQSVLPVFSPKIFIVSGLTSTSLIHFEFIFVYGVRKCSNFILLYVLSSFPHGFISGLSILFHWSIFLFVPVPYCPDNCIVIVLQSEYRL